MLSFAKLLRQASGHLPHHATTTNSVVCPGKKTNTEVNHQCMMLLAHDKTVPLTQCLRVLSFRGHFLAQNPSVPSATENSGRSLRVSVQDSILNKQNAELPGSVPGKGSPNNSTANGLNSSQRDLRHKSELNPQRALSFPTLRFAVVPSSSPRCCRRKPCCRLPLPLSHAMLEMPLSLHASSKGEQQNLHACVCVCDGATMRLCVR